MLPINKYALSNNKKSGESVYDINRYKCILLATNKMIIELICYVQKMSN